MQNSRDTDGLTETRIADGEWLGESGQIEIANVNYAGNMADIVDCILDRVVQRREAPVLEDRTLIVAEIQ